MMRRSLLLLALAVCFICSVSFVSATVRSQQHSRIRALHRYFTIVLDQDHDGAMSQAEYKHHLEKMDPEGNPNIPFSFTNIRHAEFDLDHDLLVTFEELCLANDICTKLETAAEELKKILSASPNEPVEIHLTATTSPTRMLIDWAQNTTATNSGHVSWGQQSGTYGYQADATWKTYTVSSWGLTYVSLPLFTAQMTGLEPNTTYYYIVGDEYNSSPEFSFTTLPDPTLPAEEQRTTRMITYGDQGTIIPSGATVCGWVEQANAANPFGVMLHVGDLSYAGVSGHLGEYEPTWDTWMQQISPIGSVMPYMTSVGNHESFFNFASYQNRFNMPGNERGGNGSWWFSFDYGSMHVTSFSSESDYQPGSPQYEWLVKDLSAAAANPSVQWIVLSGHRPLYSSDANEWSAHQPGCPLLLSLEPLIIEYGVDMILTGHEHMYERTYPVNNGTVFNITQPAACEGERDHEVGLHNADKQMFWDQVSDDLPLEVYNRDGAEQNAPVYIVQATAGVFQNEQLISPQPAWSAYRTQGTFGWGVVSVSTTSSGCSALLYQFQTQNSVVVDQIMLTKQVKTAKMKNVQVADQ